jgi:RNA polymerase sigma factor (sigma-70 family)
MLATDIDERLTAELPWLRHLARKLAGEDADDLVQETWLLARRDAPEPDGRRGLRGWLAQVMWHRWISIRRADFARSRREQLAPGVPVEPVLEQRAIEADVVRILHEMLVTLADDDRALLRSRFFDERTAVEIARDLGVEPGTVRSRIHRTLARLRRAIDERYGSDRSAWAPALVALPVPKTTAVKAGSTVATATKGLFLAGASTVVASLGWMLVGGSVSGDEVVAVAEARADHAATALDAPVAPKVAAPRIATESPQPDRDRWTERVGAIQTARRKRLGADGSDGEKQGIQPSELPPPSDLVPQLAQLGCVDLLPDHPTGRFKIRMHYVGEPDVGTAIESVEILEDTLHASEFSECWSNSVYMLELGAPEVPVRGAYELAYNAGDGRKVDQALGQIKAFVREHPQYAEEHAELARLLELSDDTPVNQWMPEYVEVLGRDPELDAALDALDKPSSPTTDPG